MRYFPKTRSALTLMELLVVLAILAILAAIIVPRITNVSRQASDATNASTLAGINRAMGQFEAQYLTIPTAWDGILNDSQSGLYSKLNPKLATLLSSATLTDVQIKSLVEAGMKGVHFQQESWTGAPSDSGQAYVSLIDFGTGQPVTSAGAFCILQLPDPAAFVGHNIDFPDRAFSINKWKSKFKNVFVVVGLGAETSLKGSVMTEAPIFQSADPLNYYARALCVFMVPGPGQSYFRAQYIGCFAPDGTCIQDNLNDYNQNKLSPE